MHPGFQHAMLDHPSDLLRIVIGLESSAAHHEYGQRLQDQADRPRSVRAVVENRARDLGELAPQFVLVRKPLSCMSDQIESQQWGKRGHDAGVLVSWLGDYIG